MGGAFKGILEVVNVAGGAVLFLLIGRRAWSKSRFGRNVRLGIGSLSIGLIVGTIAIFVIQPQPGDETAPKVFCCAPIGLLILVIVIEGIRSVLEENTPPPNGQ